MLIFTVLMLGLSIVDLKYLILPNSLNFSLLGLGLLFNVRGLWAPFPEALLGAGMGYGILWLLYYGFKWLTRKEGIGFGDFKLMAALGAWFGVEALPRMLLIAGVVGLVFAVIWKKVKGHENPEFPFGPSLLMAGFLQFFFR